MQILAGQRIFTRSSITNDAYEYFIPSVLSNIEASLKQGTLHSSPIDKNAYLPNAAIVFSRGRLLLSVAALDESRSLGALVRSWRDKSLDIDSIAYLHALTYGGRATQSTYRDSIVWVDGLRPVDAELIPGPASTVFPLMHDYIAFVRRDDIDIATKLALAHYQILMIHPFFDGNGRLSRVLAMVHSTKIFGVSRAFAIAAALSLHRRALRELFNQVREGTLESYLAYWTRLISWSANCVAQIAALQEQAMEKIALQIAVERGTARLVSFLVDKPLFSQSDLSRRLRSSDKLSSRYIKTLIGEGIIERHPATDEIPQFRCPASLEYWRQAMEHTACTSKMLLPQPIELTTNRSP